MVTPCQRNIIPPCRSVKNVLSPAQRPVRPIKAPVISNPLSGRPVIQNRRTFTHFASQSQSKPMIPSVFNIHIFNAVINDNQKKFKDELRGKHANVTNPNGMSPIHVAKSIAMINLIYDCGGDINKRTPEGNTALHLNLEPANINLAEALLKKGADIHAKNESGETPLFEAVKSYNLKMVEHLVELGANVNAANNQNRTPLFAATEMGNNAMVDLLLKLGADANRYESSGSNFDYSPFHLAICYPSYKLAQLFLEKGKVDPNQPVLVHNQSGDCPTSLSLALTGSDKLLSPERQTAEFIERQKIAKLLIGKSPQLPNESYLIKAVQLRMVDVVKAFVSRGAQLSNCTDSEGRTLIQIAAANGDPKMLAFLFDNGAK